MTLPQQTTDPTQWRFPSLVSPNHTTHIRELESALVQSIGECKRYKDALFKLLLGDHVGTPINRDCGAMKIIEDSLLWSDAEIEQFLKEWDEGKHELSPEDEKALEHSREKLFGKIHPTHTP
jgi:hypothetical protein